MPDVIVTHRLTKYDNVRCAVNGLNLRVAQGTVYGLLGRNGAGKTTVIRMLLGMAHPSYGQAEILGEDSLHLRPETRARIAYLAESHPLYRWMTIDQVVKFTRPFYPCWNQRLLEQILDHFELSARRRTGKLSRGQRAQVALALAVAADPEVLILDDPTLGLDTVVRRDFLESLIQIIQRRGRTILFSSHILSDVERVADRLGILVDGVLRVDCPTDHFKSSVRKVLLEFDDALPELADFPGLVNRRQCQYSLPWTPLWTELVLLFGLPAYFGYLAHRRWPPCLPCPHCGHIVPRDRPACLACQRAFPAAAPKGTEVFA